MDAVSRPMSPISNSTTTTPSGWMLRPKGSAIRIRMSDCRTIENMSRKARPNKRATRLTGVTRSRSITPIRSSEIRLNPTPAAPNMPSCTSSPGTNTL